MMADSRKQKASAAEQAETEDLPEAAPYPATGPTGKSESSAKSPRWPWFLLITLIIALPLGWQLVPEKIRRPYTEKISHWFSTPERQAAVNPPARPPAAESRKQPPAEAAPEPPVQAASSADVTLLLNSIKALQKDLRQAQQEARALIYASHTQQKIDLRTRLRWIAQPGSRLPQLHTYWEDIALLPVLDDRERAQATDMLQLARQRTSQVRDWRNLLLQLANDLPIPEAEEVSIKPDNKWLAWLAGQFRLSTSPSHERRQRQTLRNHLLQAEQQLAYGQWPPAADWQVLLEQLRQQFGGDTEINLPPDFESVQGDIRSMQQAARNWLERLASDPREEPN